MASDVFPSFSACQAYKILLISVSVGCRLSLYKVSSITNMLLLFPMATPWNINQKAHPIQMRLLFIFIIACLEIISSRYLPSICLGVFRDNVFAYALGYVPNRSLAGLATSNVIGETDFKVLEKRNACTKVDAEV